MVRRRGERSEFFALELIEVGQLYIYIGHDSSVPLLTPMYQIGYD
jgi:hypothetical protein